MQTQFLRALLTDAPVPCGFASELIGQQAAALVRKRLRLVARAQPALARSLGDQFATLFDAYAREHPIRSDQRDDDVSNFARWLESIGRYPSRRRWHPRRRAAGTR